MSDTKFKLNDGREIVINYTQSNGTSRYTVLIDGQTQERNVSCGIGWDNDSIEKLVKDRYETQDTPVIEDDTELILDPDTTMPEKYTAKKRNSREIRSIDFKLQGLLSIASLKLRRKPTELNGFFSIAKELKETMQGIATLSRQTNDPELKEKADAIKSTYEQSDYFNY